jgi:CDP-ribitol ribitolphosphotransferase
LTVIIVIAKAFLTVVYAFLKLFKVQNKITFLSRQQNVPSVDFLMLESKIKEEHPDYKTVILCKQLKDGFLGKIAYVFHMFRQLYHLATSKVAIIDSYCIPISLLNHKKSLLVIQIWHAIGNMKKFGYALLDKPEGTSTSLATQMRMHRNYDYAVISSLNFKEDFMKGFNITEEKLVEIPLPKTDLLTDKDYISKKRKELKEKYPILAEKKNVFYCPTFRKNPNGEIEALIKLSKAIDRDKYNFILSCHPVSKLQGEYEDVLQFNLSTFDLLFIADFVISDYSTVFYEAGLLELPIFSYAYDWQDYRLEREINFDIEKEFPGLFTSSPEKIAKAIDEGSFDFDKLKAFIDKNVNIKSKSSTKELVDFIFGKIE